MWVKKNLQTGYVLVIAAYIWAPIKVYSFEGEKNIAGPPLVSENGEWH